MVRRLRLKIVAVILGSLLLFFITVLLILNYAISQSSLDRVDDFILTVIDNNGFRFPPREPPRERPFEPRQAQQFVPEMSRVGRYFYAKIDQQGSVTELNLDMMFDFAEEEARSYVSYAMTYIQQTGRSTGDTENLRFMAAVKPYGWLIVFAERSIEMLFLEQLMRISLWASLIVGLILSAIAFVLAGWIVIPVQSAFERQRRFISDASHELRTPLTIINANVEVLGNEIGVNRRLNQIQAQSDRMHMLISDLLGLARADENPQQAAHDSFNLSNLVLNTALEFESAAFEQGRHYSFTIPEDITYEGDEKQIKNLVSILIDNAIRYSDEGGEVQVTLRGESDHVHISVYNTGMGIPETERDKVFDRFYRLDSSRSRESGGFGLGLAIAKSVVQSHKGKIAVTGEQGTWVRFDVEL